MGRTGIFQILFYKHLYKHSTNKFYKQIVLVHRLLPFIAKDSYKDTDGRIVLVKGELYGEPVLLGNVYAPNIYDEDFFAFLLSKMLKWTVQI